MSEEDSDYSKAITQFRLCIGVVLKPLRLYGQGYYVDAASEQLVSLAIQLHERLSGIDRPFIIDPNKLHW